MTRKHTAFEYNRMAVALFTIVCIAIDYDGEKTVKGLKGLIDEIRRTAAAARPRSLTARDIARIEKASRKHHG